MHNRKISVIGLGYVGLPVAIAFGAHNKTIGFDINEPRLDALRSNVDATLEVTPAELNAANVYYTSSVKDLSEADFHIVCVPTPIDSANKPDLTPLIKASETVGAALKVGDIVVYESTVYPGATEEVCVPILEKKSGLKNGIDFFVGYSPERINPGDKEHTFTKIRKVVSGQDENTLNIVSDVYSSVVTAGVHRAPSIKTAEAAKVIENTQRDLNIALINELAIIFDRLGVDTHAVLQAAGSKWNFLPFKPGLVGGHCIGVDPYYLTYKAQQVGYHPDVILAGRRINDSMGNFVAHQLIKTMIKKGTQISGARVLIMGLTFKENCPDLRNTRVVDVISELKEYDIQVDVYDPWVDKNDTLNAYGLSLLDYPAKGCYDGIALTVAHNEFLELGATGCRQFGQKVHTLFDVKGMFERSESDVCL